MEKNKKLIPVVKKLVLSIAQMIEKNKEKDTFVSKKIEREVEKINQIQKMTVGEKAKQITNIDYIHYILNGGTNFERSQFLKCIEGELYLKGGEVWLENLKMDQKVSDKRETIKTIA